ncbi:hypothetical protein D8674_024956 [Pyrus ussuriensis x Pyrus communis]|uniref:Uncharacterized protein n=1 Tax=Pyrus ussuriensis x Pyrus communis TaxID=2448454 RepID=A0A5N5HHT0_9ROSA|nr:hypothetical protein D8674_024956 [Pyrus ussuriensis x Pyrus communis]
MIFSTQAYSAGSGKGSCKSLPRVLRKKDLPCPPLVFGTTGISVPEPASKQTKTSATATSTSASTTAPVILPAPLTETTPTVTVEGAKGAPSILPTSSLLDLVKKFGQIKTKLQSPPTSAESSLFQNARQIFKD